MIQPHSVHLQQLCGELSQRSMHEAAHQRALPQVHHLQEGLVVSAALFQRLVLGVQFDGVPRDLASILPQRIGGQDILEFDEAVAKLGDTGFRSMRMECRVRTSWACLHGVKGLVRLKRKRHHGIPGGHEFSLAINHIMASR